MRHGHMMRLKGESVCEHRKSLGMVPYQIHSILLLFIIRHPNLVSLLSQEPLDKSLKVHIISLVVGQLVIDA